MRTLIAGLLLALTAAAQKPVPPVASEDEVLIARSVSACRQSGCHESARAGSGYGNDCRAGEAFTSRRCQGQCRLRRFYFDLAQRWTALAAARAFADRRLRSARGHSRTAGRRWRRIWQLRAVPFGEACQALDRAHSARGGEQENGRRRSSHRSRGSCNRGRRCKRESADDRTPSEGTATKETTEPVSGLLYFFLEGKHKLKQLELLYKSPVGRQMILDFEK